MHSTGQKWRTFLKNHAHEIWACDFTTIHTIFFKPLYVLVFVKHETREVVHTAVTDHPTDEWTAQQLREATPWGERPKYLIHDNDGKFGERFKDLVKDTGIKALKTPPKAPRANAICERFIGSLKREGTDNFLIFHRYQLHRIIATYADYFNEQRPHQGIDQHIPTRLDEPNATAELSAQRQSHLDTGVERLDAQLQLRPTAAVADFSLSRIVDLDANGRWTSDLGCQQYS